MTQEPEPLYRRIRRALTDLGDHWPEMLPDGPSTNAGPSGRSAPASRPPVPVQVLSLRRDVCERLASWCLLVIDDANDTPVIDGTDVPMMLAYLDRWADFLAAHEAGEDCADELERDARACSVVVTGERKRRFEVGACFGHQASDLGERVPCEGMLSALLHPRMDLLPMLQCSLDPQHVWDASTWGEIARMPVTISDAARFTQVPARTIRRWVDEGAITPTTPTRPRMVRLEDVTRYATRSRIA